MAEEKSILDGGLLEINPNAGFDDLMKAWPKEPLYRKEEPPVSPEYLVIVENEYKKAISRGRGFGKKKAMDDMKQELKSGILTYEDAEPVMVHAPRVEMMPSPRRGLVGWIKDRIFGVQMKPQAVMVLDRLSQELLKEYMKNPEPLNNAVAACALSAEDIKEATDRIITLARGHHIRNADGTITDVSDNPKYKCKK